MKLFFKSVVFIVLTFVTLTIFASERWPFPFWQHGWDCFTAWSITNMHPTDCILCFFELRELDGSQVVYKAFTIGPGASCQPATEGADWYPYLTEDHVGYGTYDVRTPFNSPEYDCVYVWACVYGHGYYQTESFGSGHIMPGYTIVDTNNPHGYTPPHKSFRPQSPNRIHTGVSLADSQPSKVRSRAARRSVAPNRLVD